MDKLQPVWWCPECGYVLPVRRDRHRINGGVREDRTEMILKPTSHCPGIPIDLVAVYEATVAFNTGGGGGAVGRREQNREALRKALRLDIDD